MITKEPKILDIDRNVYDGKSALRAYRDIITGVYVQPIFKGKTLI